MREGQAGHAWTGLQRIHRGGVGKALAMALDLFVRASIAVFLADVLRHPHDPRYRDKALPVRNLVIVGSLSLLVPALHLWRRPWPRYPWGLDALYLSIFGLDMAGNYLDLYDRYRHFDLLPHAHGTGALAVALRGLFGLPAPLAAAWATLIHELLEAQEYVTDVVAGTRNVRGLWDTSGDMAAGVLGTAVYLGAIARAESHTACTRASAGTGSRRR